MNKIFKKSSIEANNTNISTTKNNILKDSSIAVSFLKRIRRPNESVEIRILEAKGKGIGKPCTIHAFFAYDDLDKLPDAFTAAGIQSAKGVYYTLNPVNAQSSNNDFAVAGKGKCTKDADVCQRAYLPIDLDPIRPKDCAATDAEHAKALELGVVIVELFKQAADVQPFVVDSGNGCQLLYRLDDGMDAATASDMIRQILSGLNKLCRSKAFTKYNCECDSSVGNPSRIMRLPGTMNCKGASTDERPHRQAGLVSAPEDNQKGLSENALKEITMIIEQQLISNEDEWQGNNGTAVENEPYEPLPQEIPVERAEESKQWVMSFMWQHFPGVIPDKKYVDAKSGMHGTLWAVNCPIEKHENQSACVILWDDGHVVFRCQHDHCRDYRWRDFVHAVASSADEEQRILNKTVSSNLAPEKTAGTPLESPKLNFESVRSLLDIRNSPRQPLEEIELIKNKYLLRGQVFMLVAETGLGKSSLSMQLALYWAMGKPCFGIEPAKPLRTLIIQSENVDEDLNEFQNGITRGIVETGIATQEEVEAALDNVKIINEINSAGKRFTECLNALLERFHIDLVIIDPLLHYVGCDIMQQKGVGSFLRQGLYPIVRIHKIGVLLVHHTSKPLKMKPGTENYDYNSSYDGAGSAEIANFTRAVLVLNGRKTDDGRRLYELIAAKRGEHLGWTDAAGNPTNQRWLQWSENYIFWKDAPADAAIRTSDAARRQRRKKSNVDALKQDKMQRLLGKLEVGRIYSNSQLNEILQVENIETNTTKKDALIHEAEHDGIFEKVELTKDEKKEHGYAANAKRFYRLRQ